MKKIKIVHISNFFIGKAQQQGRVRFSAQIPNITYKKFSILSLYNIKNLEKTENDILNSILKHQNILFCTLFDKNFLLEKYFDENFLLEKYHVKYTTEKGIPVELKFPKASHIIYYFEGKFWLTSLNNFAEENLIPNRFCWIEEPTFSFKLPFINIIWKLQIFLNKLKINFANNQLEEDLYTNNQENSKIPNI